MTRARVNVLVLDSKLLGGSLYIGNELLVPINGISVPCLDYLALAAAPLLIRTAFYNRQNFFKYFRILVAGVKTEIKEVGNAGMCARVAYYLSRCINQIGNT